MQSPLQLSRRTFLATTAAAGGALLFGPGTLAQAAALVDPYRGSIPMVFALRSGTYQTPLADNWHAAREGQLYAWSHRTTRTHRAHDGVDVFPVAGAPLPTVYAPFAGVVAAVCFRSDNTVASTVTYRASATNPPAWDYSRAIDNVANLPLYGNFVWLRSTETASAGYFVLYAHLQNEAVLRALAPDQQLTTASAVGVLGDTGNAAGSPQLHVEVHYPRGSTFACTHCSPRKSGETALDPFASLAAASARA